MLICLNYALNLLGIIQEIRNPKGLRRFWEKLSETLNRKGDFLSTRKGVCNVNLMAESFTPEV